MAETVDGRDEVVLGLGGGIAHDELIEYGVVGISEEDGFDVGIVHADMLHAILFLVAACQLVLLDATSHIVVGMGADHKTVLRLAVHRLSINIIMFTRILDEPALILELLEVLCSLFIHPGVILRRADREIDFGLDDVIETHLVVTSLCPSLFRIEYIVRTTLHFLHQILWRTNTFEWFDYCHIC